MLNRLVRRAIFTQTNRVVGIDHDLTNLHQRGHADGVTGVIREHHKGSGVGNEATGQCDTVGDGSHAEFAYAVEQVVAAFIGRDALGTLPPGQVRARQVG